MLKKVFLTILQNSQEDTCARVSFLIKLQASACNFMKKETLAQVFSCEFCKIVKNTFFIEHLRRLLLKINNHVKWKCPPTTFFNCDCAQLNFGNIDSLFANQNESEAVLFTIPSNYNKVTHHCYFRKENTTIVSFEKISILKLGSYFFESGNREKGQIFLDK